MNQQREIIPNKQQYFRKLSGYTQKQVASILGHGTEERICHWEKGRNLPNTKSLLALAILYRVTPMQLYPEMTESIELDVEGKRNQV